MHEYNPFGFARIFTEFIDRLKVKKCVALMDYKTAKEDMLMELSKPNDDEWNKGINDLFKLFEDMTSIEEDYETEL